MTSTYLEWNCKKLSNTQDGKCGRHSNYTRRIYLNVVIMLLKEINIVKVVKLLVILKLKTWYPLRSRRIERRAI